MQTLLNAVIKNIAKYVEIALACLVLAAVVVSMLLIVITEAPGLASGEIDLAYFLEQSLNLALGIELVRLFCQHTSENIIEVLMFAIAREMVILRMEPLNTFICVLCIAALFAIRKFLFIKFEESDRIVFRGSLSIDMANRLLGIKIPGQSGMFLRDVLLEGLAEQGKTIAVGSFVEFSDCALRIDSMDGNKITRVEIIRTGN